MTQITQALDSLLTIGEVVGGFGLGIIIYWYGIGAAMDIAKRWKRR